MPDIRHKRGTRAALDALATGAGLKPGQLYILTDESRIAYALTTSTYETAAIEGEGGTGGGVVVSATAPASPTEGMQWLDTTSGIQYTRVGAAWVEPSSTPPTDIAAETHAATSKTTPVDADEIPISDSAASWALKKLTFANLKIWIGGLFVEITSATGSAKNPVGTTAQRDGAPTAGYDRYNSTLGTKEFGNGSEWVQVTRQASAVVATTSGTSYAISGIPAYATRVELHLDAVSTSGTQPLLVQAGTSAGVVATGYADSAGYDIFLDAFSGATTTGFPIPINASSTTMRGTVTLFRKPGTNRWECQGITSRALGGLVWTTGYIDLPGALDRIALSSSGADTLDFGAIWGTWS